MAPRKPEDDPYDCINMQQQPATDKGLVNAEMLAALPHKKEADPPQDTSAIYTFLGLATIPRLSKANPRLHEIPRELRREAGIRIPRCVVSCRTPSRGPSDALLRAAANPMTVAEHVEAGTLKVGRRDPNVPTELYGDDRSDLSDWEDY